jgi:hypothetical protein
MQSATNLLPGRLLRRTGLPNSVEGVGGFQIDDVRLSKAISPDAPLVIDLIG